MGIGFLEYARMEISSVRLFSYSSEYSEKAKAASEHENRLLTAEEHAQMSEIDFEDHFSSIDKLFKWYFCYLSNIKKLGVITAIGEEIKAGNARNIISFGAGPSVLEYMLKMIFQEDVHMVVTDYDNWLVEHVSNLMPNLYANTFDFYHDDPSPLINEHRIDTAIMIGSACSMDNETYIKFLKRLYNCGVCNILTFEAGVSRKRDLFTAYIMKLLHICKNLVLWFFRNKQYEERKMRFLKYERCFHAVSRTRRELERIYSRGGYLFSEMGYVDPYLCSYRLTMEKDENHD